MNPVTIAGARATDSIITPFRTPAPSSKEMSSLPVEQKWDDVVEFSPAASAIETALGYRPAEDSDALSEFYDLARNDLQRMQELAKQAQSADLTAADRAKLQQEFETLRGHLHLALEGLGDRSDYMAEYHNFYDMQRAVIDSGFYQANIGNAEDAAKAAELLSGTDASIGVASSSIADREWARGFARDVMPVIEHMQDMAKTATEPSMSGAQSSAINMEFDSMRNVLHIMLNNWGDRMMGYERFVQVTEIFTGSGFYDMNTSNAGSAAKSGDVLANMMQRLQNLFDNA